MDGEGHTFRSGRYIGRSEEDILSGLNEEKLILWYHDLYQRYIGERIFNYPAGELEEDVENIEEAIDEKG